VGVDCEGAGGGWDLMGWWLLGFLWMEMLMFGVCEFLTFHRETQKSRVLL
jgi:hypothetical protein